MRRIGLAVVVAVSVSLAPFATEARPARKVWRVGILVSANPRSYEDFVDELRKLGYIDGQNLALELRSCRGEGRAVSDPCG
jgi:putative ABC transport system substrate-binding protein